MDVLRVVHYACAATWKTSKQFSSRVAFDIIIIYYYVSRETRTRSPRYYDEMHAAGPLSSYDSALEYTRAEMVAQHVRPFKWTFERNTEGT